MGRKFMKRNTFLEHIAWTGAGIAYALTAEGVVRGTALGNGAEPSGPTFLQISDSHLGFKGTANPNVADTLERAVNAINALAVQPAFVIHTGDITHLAKPEQFDTGKQILASLKAPLFTIPGEHDTIGSDRARNYFDAFGKNNAREGVNDSKRGWYSFDLNGVHFVALVNVFDFEKMGLLGTEQISWLEKDLSAHRGSTPLVVFGHVPLYALYPKWGWTTDDSTKVLAMLRRFDAVTVLNGHIHQVIEHTEGNMRFYTASPTAYPLPAPGHGDKPKPVTIPHDALLAVLGYRTVQFEHGNTAQVTQHRLADVEV